MPQRSTSQNYYQDLWGSMEILAGKHSVVGNIANSIERDKDRYAEVEDATGVPWAVVGVIHYREGARSWSTCLHNGERIIGSGKKTRLVPAGRGPFDTWEEAAIDALGDRTDLSWNIPETLRFLEHYNGMGYRNRGVHSPYLWSYTNHGVGVGYYVGDRRYSASAVNGQAGCAPILSLLGYQEGADRPTAENGVLTAASAQRFLAEAGFDPGPIDGIIGPKTTAAAKRFYDWIRA